ncbi:MAG: ABC-F family ATP-binding cassette domain-containing protein [Oscillospiraceae bacterium]|jgi:ATP-binding cassette subfamily F protein 3
MILQASSLRFSYGSNEVIKGASFEVNDGEKVGIIGSNGCGKTTLVKLICGMLQPSSGTIEFKKNISIEHMDEEAVPAGGGTVMDVMKTAGGADRLLAEMKRLESQMGSDPSLISRYADISSRYEAVDGYHLEDNARRILLGMSFKEEDFDKDVGLLSGGERTRLALARLLISNPDVLVLDEPTNHLDVAAMEWLDRFIKDYRYTVIAVSHDRWFLKNVPTRIIEVVNGRCRSFTGGYDEYIRKRDFARDMEQREYERNAAEKKRLLEYAEKNMARSSTRNMAKSRLKMAERIDDTPPEAESHVRLDFTLEPRTEPYKEVAVIDDAGFSFGNRTLFSGFSCTVLRGEKIAVMGANGTGKSTLIKALAGEERPSEGKISLGENVEYSYFVQDVYSAVTGKDPMSYIWDRWPRMTALEVRSHLARFGFTGDRVFTEMEGLSGGELARLQLAEIALERPNLLLLDEPTNYLDLVSKDEIDSMIKNYQGTVVCVTHDRFLASGLGGRVIGIADGEARVYESYEKYIEASEEDRSSVRKDRKKPSGTTAAEERESRRERALRRQRISDLEKEIESLEAEEKKLEQEAASPEAMEDHVRLDEIYTELTRIKDEIARKTDEWAAAGEGQ